MKTLLYNADLIKILGFDFETFDISEIQKLAIVELLYTCLTLNNQNIIAESSSGEKLYLIVTQLFNDNCDKIGELDMKARFCFSILTLNRDTSTNDAFPLDILKKGVQQYPENSHYYFLLVTVLSKRKEYEEGLKYATEALKIFPQDPDVLHCRAVLLISIKNTSSCEIVKVFKDFLNVAPHDHRKVPHAYYYLSSVYLRDFLEDATEQNWQQMESAYESGLKAEKDQMPCYIPYEDDNKSVIGDLLKSKNEMLKAVSYSEKLSTTTASKLEKKPYLGNLNRKSIIRRHRELLQKCGALEGIEFSRQIPPKVQRLLKKISLLKPITLEEMNPKENHLFEDRIIELLIIDEPMQLLYSVNLIGEDENGNVAPLLIRNIKKDEMHRFQAGCRLAIINPYMQCGINHKIINDEPDCIVYLEKVNGMCRYCGEENACRKCSKCKRPYCSRECQEVDWKEMGHKIICGLKVNFKHMYQ